MFSEIKFKLGGYGTKEVIFDRPYELMDGAKRKYTGEKLRIMDCLHDGGVSSIGFNEPKLFALYKKNEDTGIRFKFDPANKSLISGGPPLAYDLNNELQFNSEYSHGWFENEDVFASKILPLRSKSWTPFTAVMGCLYAIEISSSIEEVEQALWMRVGSIDFFIKLRKLNVEGVLAAIDTLINQVKLDPVANIYYLQFSDVNCHISWRAFSDNYNKGVVTYEKELYLDEVSNVSEGVWNSSIQSAIKALEINELRIYFEAAKDRIRQINC